MSQATVKDVGANDFIKSYAALLKRSGKVRGRSVFSHFILIFQEASWLCGMAFSQNTCFCDQGIPRTCDYLSLRAMAYIRWRELCSTMWCSKCKNSIMNQSAAQIFSDQG
jgi:hypothetical protein